MQQPTPLHILLNAKASPERDILITGISNDSRNVKPGDLFIAYPGEKSDGRRFIEQALQKGAAAVLYECHQAEQFLSQAQGPLFPIENLTAQQSHIAARFYDNPSQALRMVGVTGTNGKTSTTQFIAQALTALQQRCGVVGTIGNGVFPDVTAGTHTTPDAIQLQKMLQQMQQQGAKAVAMEVSSHSLVQHRVAAVEFDTAIFTNLTRDHLDYHQTMQAYAQAKELLFQQPGLRHAVLNLDDDFGKVLAQREYLKKIARLTYSLTLSQADIHVSQFEPINKGFKLTIQTPQGATEVTLPLLGRFNISNVLAVLGVLLLWDIPLKEAGAALNHLEPVRGRMQTFGGAKQPLVIVDYAHTPDALQQALQALREHCHGKLWCVFGCGGDRDRGKRPLMAKVAEEFSDQIILTNDNPRTEAPEQIIAEIKTGFSDTRHVQVEMNRAQAIAAAVRQAKNTDVILIAGKGHEDYQIIGTQTLPFSDGQIVTEQLQLRQNGD